MKKIIFFFLIILIVFSNTRTSFAAQISGEPTVTEKTVTATVNTDVTSVTLEVYDQQGKKVAGPTITKGENPIKATIDVYNLSRGTTYELRGKDSVSVFTTNFKTVSQDTRVSGSGDWYYSVGIILANYDNAREKSMFRFTTEKLCNTARTAKIDELFQATSVAGGGVKNSTITPCFKSTTIPLKKDFESKLQSIDGMAGSKSLYYFTYGYKTDKSFHRSMGYTTLTECESDQELYKDRLVMKCTASTTAPTEPANWDSLLDAQGVDPVNIKNFEEDYTLLAPIGDTTKIDGTTKVGDYLNTLLLIAIGLCGALAVIMIVIYGVQYMGDESVFGKTEAKSHIVAAIMGLLLALGAYAILNTINPNLVGGTLTFNSVNIELEPGVGIPEGKYLQIKNASGKYIDAGSCTSAKTKTLVLFGQRTTVQEDVVDGLLRIDKKWKDKGGASYYKVNVLYGFNCRNIAGTNTKSAHAFGLALDINPQENPFQNTLKTNIPRPEFVQWFKDEGWGWGGNWNGKKDPMHFSKFAGEGGDIKIK